MPERDDRPLPRNVDRDDVQDVVDTFDGNFAPALDPGTFRTVIVAPPPPVAPGVTRILPDVTAPPSLGARVVAAIGRLGGLVGGLLVPGNTGAEGTGNLFGGPGALYPPGTTPPPQVQPVIDTSPEPLPELEPVVITPPPPPRIPTPVGNDPIMPPNWNDLSDPGGLDFGRPSPGAPILTDWPTNSPGDQLTPEPFSDPGSNPFPTGPVALPDVFDVPEFAPTNPTITDPAPLLPSPLENPNPFFVGSPSLDPVPASRPRPLAPPGTRPGSRPGTPPLIDLPGFPGLPENPRPTPRPPNVGLPDFFTDPTPDLLDDPMADPSFDIDTPNNADACQCDKPPKKKKPKPKPREVCRQGTYTQRAKGIKYAPRRIVPCEGEIQPEPKAKSRKKSKPKAKRYPTSLPDILNSPF